MSGSLLRTLLAGVDARSRLRTIAGGLGITDEDRKLIAWNNVPVVPGQSHKIDCDNHYIVWEEYGKYSTYGWQVDHAVPTVLGGADVPTNWRARHWKGNSQAGGRLSLLGRI